MTKNFDDLIAFNSGKFYGRVQLANLFTNWKQVPEDYDYYETMKKFVWENKVLNAREVYKIRISNDFAAKTLLLF